MYFVRSGFIYTPSASLLTAGQNGFLWSSSTFPSNLIAAPDINFGENYGKFTYPSSENFRSNGFPLHIFITLLLISSVVAILAKPTILSVMLDMEFMTGLPLPTPPALSFHFITMPPEPEAIQVPFFNATTASPSTSLLLSYLFRP